MSCSNIPNFDQITLDNLPNFYNNLTNPTDQSNLRQCILDKYKNISDESNVLSTLLSDYDRQYNEQTTADERNKESQSQYVLNLFYVWFKAILFTILGYFYYYFIDNPEDSIKKTTKTLSENITDISRGIKNSIEKRIVEKKE